jgi:dethiobiotin synthetase
VPLRLRLPASPHRAAIAEGAVLSPEAILDWIGEERGTITLVEGVGGWEVPITADFRVSALAERLGWPVLIVALLLAAAAGIKRFLRRR